jgi:ribosomal protein S18 acetylase RimI-like enzyme
MTVPAPTKQSKPSMNGVRIRPATPSDATSIVTLGSHIFELFFGHSLARKDLDAYLTEAYVTSAILDEIQDPRKTILVATLPSNELKTSGVPGLLQHDFSSHPEQQSQSNIPADTVVGFVQLTRGTTEPCLDSSLRNIELQRLYVHPICHGTGIGRLLMEAAEEIAKCEEFDVMWLGVWEENFKAQKVYERLGYSRVGEHGFKMGETIQVDWILTKPVGKRTKDAQ